MLADHAARVLAVASRFRAEARRVRGELHRQRVGRQDLAAHRVRERDLGRRYEIQALVGLRIAGRNAALLHREHVGFELRELRGADQRLGVDDVRRVALGVAVLRGLDVEHELSQRAVQAREPAAEERETRAGELRPRREIEQPEPLADVRVILDRKVECARRAPAAHLDVVLRRLADRYARMREVRQVEQEVAQRDLHAVELAFEALRLRADARDLRQQRRGVLALALRGADGLRERVALRLQVLRARLDVLALALERFEARGVERHAALREPGDDERTVRCERD